MHVNLQIKILVWSYALLWIVQIALLTNLAMFIKIMTAAQGWSEHSQQVLKVEAEARNAFLEAETKGRYATLDDEAKRQFEPMKQIAGKKIAELINQVADNPLQTDSANRIFERVKTRFDTQDRTIAGATFIDGKLQSNPLLVYEGIDAQNKALNEFTSFEAEERKLLLERFASVNSSVWKIIYMSVTLIIFSVLFKGFSFWWTWRTLKNARYVARELRDKTNGDERFDDLIKLIEQAG